MGGKSSKKPFIVAIAGPSGSGKSEVCAGLQKELGNVLCMSADDYFRDPKELPKIGEWENSDVPEAMRFDQLVRDLKALKEGQRVTTSVLKYPHRSLERIEKILTPAKFMIIEGFLVLYDEKVRDLCDVKIFIDIPKELQFKRRMGRESRRGEAYVRQVVIPNYEIYGLPTKQYADAVIDGDKQLTKVVAEVKTVIKGL